MWPILLSGISFFINFFVRSILVKFVIMFALYYVVLEFTQALVSENILPNVNSIAGVFADIPATVWYFADIGAISFGVPLCISAYATRFIIRRIPFLN